MSALPGLLRRWPDCLVPGAVYKNTRSGRASLLRQSVEALGATPHPLRTYAGLVSNCTSKMLLGYPCLGPPRPGLDANRAIAVVRAAGFVGLTERFADSLLLLKRTFDERFRRSGEEILDLVLSLPSRRRLAASSDCGNSNT